MLAQDGAAAGWCSVWLLGSGDLSSCGAIARGFTLRFGGMCVGVLMCWAAVAADLLCRLCRAAVLVASKAGQAG